MKTQAGAGTRGLMLDPVFSVMVGGHRQARLDRHWGAGSDRDLRRAALVQMLERSFRNLHRDHHYLHRLAFALFTLTFLAVTLHFFFYLSWILIFTAFFPAWGAAIHGILTQNEVVRVSAMAGRVWQQLTDLREAFRLHQVLRARETRSVSTRWRRTQDLRELVQASSDILSDENRYWRSLLQHNETNLPG
ncbi:MAG: hypothetical protein ACP5DC_09930 [Halothiobacillaceae bacterium]